MTGSGIYEIRHIESGKRYIGSAKNFKKRWIAHRNHLLRGTHHSPHLQRSWDKHGETAFQFAILELCAHSELLDREQAWFDLAKPEFNVCPQAHSTAGRKFSEETKQKISAAHAGKKRGPRSDEHRALLSRVLKGKKKSDEHMQALQAGRAAQVFTDERRAKMSQALKKSYENGSRQREKSQDHCHKIGQFYAKLTDDQVREIRRLRAAGVTGRQLSVQFNSNPGTISNIVNGKRYCWVE